MNNHMERPTQQQQTRWKCEVERPLSHCNCMKLKPVTNSNEIEIASFWTRFA